MDPLLTTTSQTNLQYPGAPKGITQHPQISLLKILNLNLIKPLA